MNSDPATDIDPTTLCAALQMSDSYYPTGAYSHSHGLEGLIDAGIVRDRATLREYALASLLPSLAKLELPLVAHGHRAFLSADWHAVSRLCVLASGLRASREARLASEAIGRARISLLVSLRGNARAAEFQSRADAGGWPQPAALAAALEACAIGASERVAMAGVFYGACASLVSAAMKLLRIGQNGGQSLLTELLAQAGPSAMHAASVPEDEIGWFNPWLDIASARHEHARERLFIS